MKLTELQNVLDAHPLAVPRFVLPDGGHIPVHAHITEVGHVIRNFIDCGGLTGTEEKIVLQTHVGRDISHRLRSDRFARILRLGNQVVPNPDLEVNIEYDCCAVSQYPIKQARPTGDYLDLTLARGRTQCRARERPQSAKPNCCSATSASCC